MIGGFLPLLEQVTHEENPPATVRHGRGICIFQGLHLYEGWWKDGLPFGRGRFTYYHGYCYDGQFKNVKREYDGWIDYTKHGHGTMRYSNEKKHEGIWIENELAGKGTCTLF